jgi:hypothetical protein
MEYSTLCIVWSTSYKLKQNGMELLHMCMLMHTEDDLTKQEESCRVSTLHETVYSLMSAFIVHG